MPQAYHHANLEGSFRQPLSGVAAAVDPQDYMQVTVALDTTAEPEHYDAVKEFGAAYGLSAYVSAACHTVLLMGFARDMQDAFKTELHQVDDRDLNRVVRARAGYIKMPERLLPHVVAVLGLDDRPAAKPYFRQRSARQGLAQLFRQLTQSKMPRPLTALEVARAYQSSAGATGKGVTIALIELGGGYTHTDLTDYFTGLDLAVPDVESVSVLGAHNSPGVDADGEVLLDIEVAGAVAPGAKIAVYFAPNTDQGFLEAILQAATDPVRKPQLISISWGSPENRWTAQALEAMNQAFEQCDVLGVTVLVAAGDAGATDGERQGLHCDFPASSPFVVACGGTRLLLEESGEIRAETVWNDTATGEGAGGGGVSQAFPLPEYQREAAVPCIGSNVTGRGVPDLAGNADPESGYWIIVNGSRIPTGGTSAVAPLVAAMLARIIEKRGGAGLGFLNPVLYQNRNVFRDVTLGHNEGYTARAAWDCCSGLGSLIGTELEAILMVK